MKTWLSAAAAVLLAVSALAPTARAEGPRASSENNWPGMGFVTTNPLAVPPNVMAPAPQPAAPRYVWQEGYDNHSRWQGHWVLVQ